MDKIIELLEKEGWEEIKADFYEVTGKKEGFLKKCRIVREKIDLAEEFEMFAIPFEEDFLVYRVNN